MNSIKAFSGAWAVLATLIVFASTMVELGIEPRPNDFTAAKLINDSFLCHQDQLETGSSQRLLISCNLESALVTTTLVHHQYQVHILLDGWDWKIDQVIWQIPRV